MLAIPSVLIGFIAIEPMLFGSFFKDVIFVNEAHHAMEELKHEFHGPIAMATHALTTAPFWLALAGVATSYFFYMVKPAIPAAIKKMQVPSILCWITNTTWTGLMKSFLQVAHVCLVRDCGMLAIKV
jgi:NADH-quinone oxidoreductase subunit L